MTDLVAAPSGPDIATDAIKAIRSLIKQIVLVPDDAASNRHLVDLHGDLALILTFASARGRLPSQRLSRLALAGGAKSVLGILWGRPGWLRGQDLNLWPSGYEPDELPGCSTPLVCAAVARVCCGFAVQRRILSVCV